MKLTELRKISGVSQKELADYLHVKQNTYSQYENGHRELPLEALIALAKFYDTSTDYILELTEVDDPYPRK